MFESKELDLSNEQIAVVLIFQVYFRLFRFLWQQT